MAAQILLKAALPLANLPVALLAYQLLTDTDYKVRKITKILPKCGEI